MAEKEYIEREKALKAVCTWCGNGEKDSCMCADKREILDIPSADVVEVVRCKDCKHGKKIDTKTPPFKYYRSDCIVCECEDVVGDEPMIYFPTHFCSYGVKKEETGYH